MDDCYSLVTGGAGFIGAHLTAHLTQLGRQVIVLDDLSVGSHGNLDALGVEPELIVGDITLSESFAPLHERRITTIFHLAAQASVPLSVHSPTKDFEVNARGTLNVLEFARSSGASVVFPSTVSVYSPKSLKPINEDAVIHASSPYGAAKVAGENYCFAYANCYGLRVVVARLFNVYGPLMTKYVIHDLVRKLQANPKTLEILGDGRQTRDYLYVTDAVKALVLLSESGLTAEAYNIGSGIPIQIIDLASLIISALGLEGIEISCTQEKATGDIQDWFADTSKLTKLGFRPEVSFASGLHKTVASLRS